MSNDNSISRSKLKKLRAQEYNIRENERIRKEKLERKCHEIIMDMKKITEANKKKVGLIGYDADGCPTVEEGPVIERYSYMQRMAYLGFVMSMGLSHVRYGRVWM